MIYKLYLIWQKYYPRVYCTLGVHPHDGVNYNQMAADFIRTHAIEKEVVAIGEIGLDYYYNQSAKEDQTKYLQKQRNCGSGGFTS